MKIITSSLIAIILSTLNVKNSLADEVKLNEVELEEYGRRETGGIAIKRGLSWGDDKRYANTAAALITDGYLAEFRLRREESHGRSEEDEIKIAGITLRGNRRYKAYLTEFTFGMELYELTRRWYDLKLYGQVTGGFQVVKNNLFIESERIPGDPEVNFFAGGGGRGEAVVRIPRIGSYFVSIGIGATGEYLKDVDGFIEEPTSGTHYGFYALIRLSREKVRKELRIKKQ